MTELLLSEEQRFTLFPIKYPKIWDMYKKQLASFWIASEIDFSKDKSDWNKLSDNERHFIKHILAFFAGSDGIVSVNILDNFSKDVKILEAQMTYNFQGTMEAIHSEVYSLMIETYIDNSIEKNILFNAIETIPCIKKKADWALKWIRNNDDKIFAKRLIAFAIVEGLFFSGAFCAIYWIKERNILPGLTKSNEFIARDERLHTEFACLLYSMIQNKISQEEIYLMFDEALEIEIEFITESLPVKLIGMNNILMIEYIKYVADWLLSNLGYEKKYNVQNPFSFMNTIGMESRSNFFDERTSTYQKANSHNNLQQLEANEDF
jgi:ribonucleotide reductase beta subunit family protein with ferritin-like domain